MGLMEIGLQWFFTIVNGILSALVFSFNLKFLIRIGLKNIDLLEMNYIPLFILSGFVQFIVSIFRIRMLMLFGPIFLGSIWDDLGRASIFLLLVSILVESIRRGILWKD